VSCIITFCLAPRVTAVKIALQVGQGYWLQRLGSFGQNIGFSSSKSQSFSPFLSVMDLSRSIPTKACNGSSTWSSVMSLKSTCFSISFSSSRPDGGTAMPRLSPSVPVEKTRSLSMSGIFWLFSLSGIKIRSSVLILDCGKKSAFPVRFRFFVMFFMVSRFPFICASLTLLGMLFSVIIKIMNMPISIDANPSLMYKDVFNRIRTMPSIMSSMPMIFALI